MNPHRSQPLDMPDQELARDGAELSTDFWYPRNPGHATHLVLGLVDVRAADSIRISYDFDRDGWLIEQAQKFEWGDEDDGSCDPMWKEVAFVKAWASEIPGPFTK
jgi:hypothetical protein